MLNWLKRRLQVWLGVVVVDPVCHHHWHWLVRTVNGETYRHCCRCGRLHATLVTDAASMSTHRALEHGAYFTRRVDIA